MTHENNNERMHVVSTRRRNDDADLMQVLEDTSTSSLSPSSSSTQQLQARMQVRNRVQVNANANANSSNFGSQVMGSFDEDDSDDDDDDDSHGGLINLNMEPSTSTSNHHMTAVPPMDNLANGAGSLIMKQGNGNANAFSHLQDNTNERSPPLPKRLIPQSTMTDPLSPPRPLKQPMGHAKRAVSTLFGSSYVVNDKQMDDDNDNDNDRARRTTSLLDTVSQSTGAATRTNTGLNPIMAQGSWMKEQDSFDLLNFNTSLPSVPAPLSHANARMNPSGMRTSQEPASHKLNIDIGDPFSYAGRSSSSMNQRHNTNSGNRHAQMNDTSNVAKSWFGNSLNYTTQSMNMSQEKDNQGFMQEHHLLDRLHQEGADKLPNQPLSLQERIMDGSEDLRNSLNPLNIALFLSYGFSTFASAVPIALIPTIAMDILSNGENGEEGDDGALSNASVFASTVATHALLGTACGKFLNGPLGDVFGARRVACLYALLVSISLTALSWGHSSGAILVCCAAVEFFQSVQWPCTVVILAAHYGNSLTNEDAETGRISPSSSSHSNEPSTPKNAVGRYEKAIYIVSLGSRCGALLGSISTTILLKYQQDSWRVVARLAAMVRAIMDMAIFLNAVFSHLLSLIAHLYTYQPVILY